MGEQWLKLRLREDNVRERLILDFIDKAPRSPTGKRRVKPCVVEALALGIEELDRRKGSKGSEDDQERSSTEIVNSGQDEEAEPMADGQPIQMELNGNGRGEDVSNLAGISFDL